MKKSFYFYMFIILALQTLAYNTIDHDYWARLLQGNAFWQFGSIMNKDPFSYTQTHLWLDHEWGSSIIFSFIQDNFGFIGILINIIIMLIFSYNKCTTINDIDIHLCNITEIYSNRNTSDPSYVHGFIPVRSCRRPRTSGYSRDRNHGCAVLCT